MSSERYESYWEADSPSPLTDPLTPARRSFLWEHVTAVTGKETRLLDCGAGDGSLVTDARARGLRAAGLEISAAAIELARQRDGDLELHRHSVEQLPWPVENASWDVVVAFEVIEHLLEPRAMLAGARAALVRGGHLALSTPYHGRLKNVAIAALRFDSHFAVEGDHVRFFTDASIRRLLDATGFDVVDLTHLGRFRFVWANTLVWARKR